MLLSRFALVVALMMVPIYASADSIAMNKAKAREAYRQASQSYDLGEYKDALMKFKEAYRYYEEPSFLFNIGQCHRQLGQRQDAIRFFRTYLSKTPDAPNRSDVEQMIAKLENEQAQEQLAREKPNPPPANVPEPAKVTTIPVSTAAPMVQSDRSPRHVPVYKKWWLWTGVAVVAAGAAVGLAIGLQPTTPKAPTSFGTIQPF